MPLPLWFPPASMHALCDSGAWMRGMALFRAGQVRRLEVVPLDDHWMLPDDDAKALPSLKVGDTLGTSSPAPATAVAEPNQP